jgi:hypothetical protein
MVVSPSTLRLTWAVVEETPPGDLLYLSDAMLIELLSRHVAQQVLLSREEVFALCDYLGSKLSLIRDITESRLPSGFYYPV